MQDPERFWLKSYSDGVPADIEPDRYSSIVELLTHAVQDFPDRPAFANFGTTITFAEFDVLSRRFAAYLLQIAHLAAGSRVAIMLPNIIQYPVAIFGALRAGMVVVNVDPMYTARELTYQLDDSDATLIVTLENFAHVVEHALSETSVATVVTTRVGDQLGFPRSLLINTVSRLLKRGIPKWRIAGAITFRAALAAADPEKIRDADLNPTDTAFLQYTGGTTGRSKAAVLCHRNIIANVLQGIAWCAGRYDPGREISITALPLYHIFSLSASCLFTMAIGGLNVLITDPRDLKGFVRELKNWPFTYIVGVNTLFRALLNTGRLSSVDFGHLKVSLAGGMAVTPEVAQAWQHETGCVLLESYGLTEAAPAVCMNPIGLTSFNARIGLPVPSTRVQIRGENGLDAGIDRPGELCVKGPQLTSGYWNRPDEPDESDRLYTHDGWLRTGDYAEINAEGFVKLLDRKKDMILVSGFNVYPNEIEGVAALHPGVLECAAIGISDNKSGEVVKLFVVKKDKELTRADLQEYLHDNLTGYKRPKALYVRIVVAWFSH